jgi:hypothetical protein
VRKINQFSSTFALFEDSAWLRALAFLTCYFSFQIVNLVLLLKHCINGPILRIKSRWRSAATTIKACSVHIEPGLLMCFQIRLTFHCVHYSGFHLLRLLGVEMKVGADNTSKHFLLVNFRRSLKELLICLIVYCAANLTALVVSHYPNANDWVHIR